jgi:hypothetical protein
MNTDSLDDGQELFHEFVGDPDQVQRVFVEWAWPLRACGELRGVTCNSMGRLGLCDGPCDRADGTLPDYDAAFARLKEMTEAAVAEAGERHRRLIERAAALTRAVLREHQRQGLDSQTPLWSPMRDVGLLEPSIEELIPRIDPESGLQATHPKSGKPLCDFVYRGRDFEKAKRWAMRLGWLDWEIPDGRKASAWHIPWLPAVGDRQDGECDGVGTSCLLDPETAQDATGKSLTGKPSTGESLTGKPSTGKSDSVQSLTETFETVQSGDRRSKSATTSASFATKASVAEVPLLRAATGNLDSAHEPSSELDAVQAEMDHLSPLVSSASPPLDAVMRHRHLRKRQQELTGHSRESARSATGDEEEPR